MSATLKSILTFQLGGLFLTLKKNKEAPAYTAVLTICISATQPIPTLAPS